MKWVVSLWEIYWYHLTQIIIERWPHLRQLYSEQHISQSRRPSILSYKKYENSCSCCALCIALPALHLITPQHLLTTTFRASMMSQTRPIVIGTSELHAQPIWSMHYDDSKLQMLFSGEHRFSEVIVPSESMVMLLCRIGNIIGRMYCKKNLLKLLRPQATRIPGLFLQLTTVILLLRSTMLIMMSILWLQVI